jgi:hypothetical protein
MFPKNMYIGILDRDIFKHKCNIEKRKKTYNIYSMWEIVFAENHIALQLELKQNSYTTIVWLPLRYYNQYATIPLEIWGINE